MKLSLLPRFPRRGRLGTFVQSCSVAAPCQHPCKHQGNLIDTPPVHSSIRNGRRRDLEFLHNQRTRQVSLNKDKQLRLFFLRLLASLETHGGCITLCESWTGLTAFGQRWVLSNSETMHRLPPSAPYHHYVPQVIALRLGMTSCPSPCPGAPPSRSIRRLSGSCLRGASWGGFVADVTTQGGAALF